MAIFNESYLNNYFEQINESLISESTEYYTSDGAKFKISSSDIKLIKENVNRICSEIKVPEKHADEVKAAKFKSIKSYDGTASIMLSGITKDAYDNGYGLDFEAKVARSLNKCSDLKKYFFSTEDYPGINIDLR